MSPPKGWEWRLVEIAHPENYINRDLRHLTVHGSVAQEAAQYALACIAAEDGKASLLVRNAELVGPGLKRTPAPEAG